MRGDRAIDRAADGLARASRRAAVRGGVAAKAADELAEDAAFLRQLKPSLILARARGEDAKGDEPMTEAPETTETARATAPRRNGGGGGGGPNPLLLVAAAFALGIVLAKVLDWRSHAHPRD